jgi:hypothetical protein
MVDSNGKNWFRELDAQVVSLLSTMKASMGLRRQPTKKQKDHTHALSKTNNENMHTRRM